MKRGETVILFDLDDTIIKGNSFHAFIRYEFRSGGLLQAWNIVWTLILRKLRIIDSVDLKNRILRRHLGKSDAVMEEYFHTFFRTLKGSYSPHIVRMVRTYIARGYEVVIISGALYEYARYIAEDLDVRSIVATRLTYREKLFCGTIEEPEMLGEAKRQFILRSQYAGRRKIFYTDSLTDLPLLRLSDKGYIVSRFSDDHIVRFYRGT